MSCVSGTHASTFLATSGDWDFFSSCKNGRLVTWEVWAGLVGVGPILCRLSTDFFGSVKLGFLCNAAGFGGVGGADLSNDGDKGEGILDTRISGERSSGGGGGKVSVSEGSEECDDLELTDLRSSALRIRI